MVNPAIADLIPHAGSMVLLEHIEAWDKTTIRCRTTSHRSPANPLRRDGILSVTAGIEYGAQAMAVHGGLLGGDTAPANSPAYLVSLREVALHVTRLDNQADDLIITATALNRSAEVQAYRFTVMVGSTVLVDGQATVFTPLTDSTS